MIRIVLADDHTLFRESLKTMLERQTMFQVAGEASDGRMAVDMCDDLHPNIVLMDINMPGLNGIEATKRIVAKNQNIRVIALSMMDDGYLVSQMLKAGASAYLLKDSVFEDLVKAIHCVMGGTSYLSPKIASVVIEEVAKPNEEAGEIEKLSSREREVLQLLSEGKASKEIAIILDISTKTVDNHRSQIMQKLDLHSIAELTKYAIRHGLTFV